MDSWQQITFIPTKYYVSNKWHEGKKKPSLQNGMFILDFYSIYKNVPLYWKKRFMFDEMYLRNNSSICNVFLSFNIIFALDLFWHIFEKKKVACNENVSLHFIEHKPLISEQPRRHQVWWYLWKISQSVKNLHTSANYCIVQNSKCLVWSGISSRPSSS